MRQYDWPVVSYMISNLGWGGMEDSVINETGFTLSRPIPRLFLPWSQVRDWDRDSNFWNLEIESLTRLFFWLFRDRDWDRDWTFHIFETETETETWMSLKIETFRDRDFSIMTFNTVPREKFQLAAASWNLSLGSSVRVCLFTFGDDEHAIELEEYVSAQG